METIFWLLVIVVVGLVGWGIGASRARGRYGEILENLTAAVEEGRVEATSRGEELPGVGRLRSALRGVGGAGAPAETGSSRGGSSPGAAPPRSASRASGAGASSEGVVLTALDRIRRYLKGEVEDPLQGGLERGGESAEVGARDALVALNDLYFYLRPIPEGRAPEDLNEIARDAGGEYAGEWGVDIDVHVPERPTTVEVDRESLLDAVYLALHNAGTFGEGKEVEVVVRYQEGDCWLVVRDRGPGFGDEALERAFEPFYTTADSALGLGLYQVRRIVQDMGGTVAVRNRRGGGGQLEIVLPGTDD